MSSFAQQVAVVRKHAQCLSAGMQYVTIKVHLWIVYADLLSCCSAMLSLTSLVKHEAVKSSCQKPQAILKALIGSVAFVFTPLHASILCRLGSIISARHFYLFAACHVALLHK
jgi:hypothetical protein